MQRGAQPRSALWLGSVELPSVFEQFLKLLCGSVSPAIQDSEPGDVGVKNCQILHGFSVKRVSQRTWGDVDPVEAEFREIN